MNKSIESRVIDWYLFGNIGRSSEYIIKHMLGKLEPTIEAIYFPIDAYDFQRCVILLNYVPEWRSRLHELGVKSDYWKKLAKNWNNIEILIDNWDNNISSEQYYVIRDAMDKTLKTESFNIQ